MQQWYAQEISGMEKKEKSHCDRSSRKLKYALYFRAMSYSDNLKSATRAFWNIEWSFIFQKE